MAKIFVDPPELAEHAMGGNPPMSAWPGTWINQYDVMASMGDDRDWFRYWHKYNAWEQVVKEFFWNRKKRREKDRSKDFKWNQVLIMGDYGVGKTTLGSKIALECFRQGHAVFSNASLMFGWHLEGEELYTAMGFMPRDALLLVDEGSAALAGRVGHGVAIASFGEMNLNSRKKNAIVVYMTAQDYELAAVIRRGCKEVWRPKPKDKMVIVDDEDDDWSGERRLPHSNPDNFRIAWDVWDDFPYRKADIIDGKQDDEGFGDPTFTYYDEGENVRMAFMLNNSFALAKAGGATVADRDRVKDLLRKFHGAIGEGDDGGEGDVTGQFVEFFIQERDKRQATGETQEYYTAGEVGQKFGMDAAAAGKKIQQIFGLRPVKGKGYHAGDLLDKLNGWLGEE